MAGTNWVCFGSYASLKSIDEAEDDFQKRSRVGSGREVPSRRIDLTAGIVPRIDKQNRRALNSNVCENLRLLTPQGPSHRNSIKVIK